MPLLCTGLRLCHSCASARVSDPDTYLENRPLSTLGASSLCASGSPRPRSPSLAPIAEGRVLPDIRPVPGLSRPELCCSPLFPGRVRIGLADSEGSPGPAPGCGPPGGHNQGRVRGTRKAESETRSKREAQRIQTVLEFLLPLQISGVAVRVWARTFCSDASVGRPYSG